MDRVELIKCFDSWIAATRRLWLDSGRSWPGLADAGATWHALNTPRCSSEARFSFQHAHTRLAYGLACSKHAPSMLPRPHLRASGTSKSLFSLKEYSNSSIVDFSAGDAPSELAKVLQSLPEAALKHPKALQRAALELPRASPRGVPEAP